MRYILLAVAACATAFAQNPPAKLAFEVASVKPVPPPTPATFGSSYYKIDDGRVDMSGLSLQNLVQIAYRDPWDLVAPDWLTNQTFELHAKFPAGATKEQFLKCCSHF